MRSIASTSFAEIVAQMGCHATDDLILMIHDLIPFSASTSCVLDNGAGASISTHIIT